MTFAGISPKKIVASLSVNSLIAGLISGFMQVIIAVSLAGLIFSGPLEPHLARGVGIGLVTSIVCAIVAALLTPSLSLVSSVQDNPAVLLAVAASALVAALGPVDSLLPTVIALIMLTTTLTGAIMGVMGYFRLGGLVRYIPYPVMGGFLAGTGWLLFLGGMHVMLGDLPGLDDIPALFAADNLILWIPGMLMGLALLFSGWHSDNVAIMPAIMLGTVGMFFMAAFATGVSLQELQTSTLVLGVMGDEAAWTPLPLGDLLAADWGAIAGQAGNIAAVVILSVIVLLLNVSGIELALQEDVDLNSELRSAGTANIISGALSGMIGFQAMSFNVLSRKVGADGRGTNLIAGAVNLLVLVAGLSILALAPRLLFGGTLVFLGLSFLHTWVIEGYNQLSRVDYGVVVMILLIIIFSDFLVGVSVGVVVMLVIFVWKYSRVNIFHHVLNGAQVTSHVERDPLQRRWLEDLGLQIEILVLQGYIFFGTANSITQQVNHRLSQEHAPLQFLVIDFRRVAGLDSSAAFSFSKLRYLAGRHNFTLVLTNLSAADRRDLERGGLRADDRLHFFNDMDGGLEWCENILLKRREDEFREREEAYKSDTLELQFKVLNFPEKDTRELRAFLDRVEFAPGESVTHQGELSPDLYFIETGRLAVFLNPGLDFHPDEQIRIGTLTTGTIVGELSFYLNIRRSASVVAEEDTVAYRLTPQGMAEMQRINPRLAAAFNEFMVRVVAERLMTANRKLAVLH